MNKDTLKNIIIEIKHHKEFPLEKKMKEQGLSIRQLAEKSGVNYTYISRLLSQKSYASTQVADKLLTALGIHDNPKTK